MESLRREIDLLMVLTKPGEVSSTKYAYNLLIMQVATEAIPNSFKLPKETYYRMKYMIDHLYQYYGYMRIMGVF